MLQLNILSFQICWRTYCTVCSLQFIIKTQKMFHKPSFWPRGDCTFDLEYFRVFDLRSFMICSTNSQCFTSHSVATVSGQVSGGAVTTFHFMALTLCNRAVYSSDLHYLGNYTHTHTHTYTESERERERESERFPRPLPVSCRSVCVRVCARVCALQQQ